MWDASFLWRRGSHFSRRQLFPLGGAIAVVAMVTIILVPICIGNLGDWSVIMSLALRWNIELDHSMHCVQFYPNNCIYFFSFLHISDTFYIRLYYFISCYYDYHKMPRSNIPQNKKYLTSILIHSRMILLIINDKDILTFWSITKKFHYLNIKIYSSKILLLWKFRAQIPVWSKSVPHTSVQQYIEHTTRYYMEMYLWIESTFDTVKLLWSLPKSFHRWANTP